jgi:ABC-type bacteriocin/lantibiotic exporter with double-glycine peptidase domain
LKITPHQQEQPFTCAVACLRIVAEYFGIKRSEAELVPICETTLDGTTPENLAQGARQIGLSAKISYDDPTVLNKFLIRQNPVIVFLGIRLNSDPANIEIHAVVVFSENDKTITYIDPEDGYEHEQKREDFFGNWQYAFHVAILISKD